MLRADFHSKTDGLNEFDWGRKTMSWQQQKLPSASSTVERFSGSKRSRPFKKSMPRTKLILNEFRHGFEERLVELPLSDRVGNNPWKSVEGTFCIICWMYFRASRKRRSRSPYIVSIMRKLSETYFLHTFFPTFPDPGYRPTARWVGDVPDDLSRGTMDQAVAIQPWYNQWTKHPPFHHTSPNWQSPPVLATNFSKYWMSTSLRVDRMSPLTVSSHSLFLNRSILRKPNQNQEAMVISEPLWKSS